MIKWFTLVAIITLIISCSKQSPDGIASDYIDSTFDLERGEACRQLDLSKDLLEINNTKNLFVCSNWVERFPTLFKKLTEVDNKKWNYLANPVNNLFFNNKENRNKAIDIVEEMDDKGGLDEFAKVITALSDSNFFGNIHVLFECTKNQEKCQTNQKITREDLKDFYSFFHASENDISRLVSSIDDFNKVLSLTGMSFFDALSNDLKSQEFVDARYHLFDQFIKKFNKANIREEIAFLRNIFKAKDEQGRPKILRLLTKDIKKDDFKYLLEYASVKDQDQWKDFRLLDKLISAGIACEGFLGDRAMKVDVSDHLNLFVRELFEKDRNHFFAQSIESLGVLKTAQTLCDKFSFFESKIVHPLTYKTETYRLNYVSTVSKTTKLLMISSYFNLFDFLQDQVPETVENRQLFLIDGRGIKYFQRS